MSVSWNFFIKHDMTLLFNVAYWFINHTKHCVSGCGGSEFKISVLRMQIAQSFAHIYPFSMLCHVIRIYSTISFTLPHPTPPHPPTQLCDSKQMNIRKQHKHSNGNMRHAQYIARLDGTHTLRRPCMTSKVDTIHSVNSKINGSKDIFDSP